MGAALSSTGTEMEDPNKWQLDKKIPVAGILAVAVFIVGQTWYLAGELADLRNKQRNFDEFMKSSQPQAAQIAVITEKVSTLSGSVQRLEDYLRHAIPNK